MIAISNAQHTNPLFWTACSNKMSETAGITKNLARGLFNVVSHPYAAYIAAGGVALSYGASLPAEDALTMSMCTHLAGVAAIIVTQKVKERVE